MRITYEFSHYVKDGHGFEYLHAVTISGPVKNERGVQFIGIGDNGRRGIKDTLFQSVALFKQNGIIVGPLPGMANQRVTWDEWSKQRHGLFKFVDAYIEDVEETDAEKRFQYVDDRGQVKTA